MMNELVANFGKLCGLCDNFHLDIIEFGNGDESTISMYVKDGIKCGIPSDEFDDIECTYEDIHEIYEIFTIYRDLYQNKLCDVENNIDIFKKITAIEQQIINDIEKYHDNDNMLGGYIKIANTTTSEIYVMVHDILKTVYQPFLIVRDDKRVLVEKISTAPCINNADITWTNNVKRLHKIVGE